MLQVKISDNIQKLLNVIVLPQDPLTDIQFHNLYNLQFLYGSGE